MFRLKDIERRSVWLKKEHAWGAEAPIDAASVKTTLSMQLLFVELFMLGTDDSVQLGLEDPVVCD